MIRLIDVFRNRLNKYPDFCWTLSLQYKQDLEKEFDRSNDKENFMCKLLYDIGQVWGPVLYYFTDWALKNAHYPENIKVLQRDGECVDFLYQHHFKEKLQNTTILSSLWYNNELLSCSADEIKQYTLQEELNIPNTLIDSGTLGSIVKKLHKVDEDFRSEMLMFFSLNPYIKSFLVDCDALIPFYQKTFKEGQGKIRHCFCMDLLEMFEAFPKSYKKPKEYTKNDEGVVQPLLEPVDEGSFALHKAFYEGVEDSLKQQPFPDITQAMTHLYELWKSDFKAGKEKKRKHLLITTYHYDYCYYYDSTSVHDFNIENYDEGCLLFPKRPVRKATQEKFVPTRRIKD